MINDDDMILPCWHVECFMYVWYLPFSLIALKETKDSSIVEKPGLSCNTVGAEVFLSEHLLNLVPRCRLQISGNSGHCHATDM